MAPALGPIVGLIEERQGQRIPPGWRRRCWLLAELERPALQVADLGATLFALAHLAAIKGGGEGLDLLGGERAGHGIKGMGGNRVRDQWAEVSGGGSISTQQGGSLQWM